MNEQHVVLPGSARPAKAGAERVGPADPNTQIELTVTLRAPQLPDANHLPAQPMTREELAAQYGASKEDADRAAAVFQRYGLKVEDVSLLTHSMRLSGTVQDVEAAFRPNLAIYHDAKQGTFRGRTGELEIPVELEGIVTGVFGLDERRVAKRGAGTDVRTTSAAGSGLAALTPADLEQRYNFPPGGGAGQQIGIAEFEGGYFASDLDAFCQKYGRPVPAVTTVPLGIPAYTLAQIQKLPASQRQEELDASVEVMMDIQIIAGLCPQAEIFVYFAPFTEQGWVDLLNQVVKGTPAQPVSLSISWGLAEDAPDWSAGAIQAINQSLNACAALGITVCISSGDDGSGDQLDDGRAHVNFPASSPFVLSVGGTMLTGSGTKVDEVTWDQPPGTRAQGGGATGGGVSVVFPRPAWQTVQIASLNQGSIDGRVLPDVSALAGPPFYDLIFLGQDQPNGGTSASAPLWAALVARINAGLAANKQHRFLTPLLYQQGPNGKTLGEAACRDITQGSNASHPNPGVGYNAGPGYDAVTGWGVPVGALLLSSL